MTQKPEDRDVGATLSVPKLFGVVRAITSTQMKALFMSVLLYGAVCDWAPRRMF